MSAKTTIPIPKVHAYGFSDTGLNGLPYIIMDYVDGRNLKDLGFKSGEIFGFITFGGSQTLTAKHLHRQLADVYVQLRQLEFPRIGALGLPSRDVPALACDLEDITVCNRPLSIEIASQELDDLEPRAIFVHRATVSTARQYVDGLLSLADNQLQKRRDQGMDENEPASILYTAHHFKRFVQDEWLDTSGNLGPFVLSKSLRQPVRHSCLQVTCSSSIMHGDMENAMSNLLFDKDYNLMGVVDWEWSRVIPAQLMVPLIWLLASQLSFVLLIQESYHKQIVYLRACSGGTRDRARSAFAAVHRVGTPTRPGTYTPTAPIPSKCTVIPSHVRNTTARVSFVRHG